MAGMGMHKDYFKQYRYKNNNKCSCGKAISNTAKLCRSCSKKDKNNPNYKNPQHRFKEKTSQWKTGKPLCIECNKELCDYRSKRCSLCAGKQHELWMKKLFQNPKNHFRYINGQSQDPYPIKFSKKLKEKIRLRDNYICKNCEIKHNIVANQEEKMHVHHIDYNKQNCKKHNLITLCNRCNQIANSNRDYWYAYFTYIMEVLDANYSI